jgi:signal transduction histidine kinase
LSTAYQGLQAHDGLQALQLLNEAQHKPELVISDIMMPRLDGIGLLTAMRSSPSSELAAIPVIFLSARAGEEARSEGIIAGADDYLPKPFSARELLIRATSRIELSRLRLAAAKREQQLRCEAEQANAVKDRFLAVLSHELRTPLTPALLITDQLQNDSTLAAAVREDLAMVTRQIRLQVQLIDDLLDITKSRQGKLQLHMQYVDMKLVVRQTIDLFQRAATDKGVAIRTFLEAEQTHVNGDSTRLQQILWNIIGNAVKFTPSGGSIVIRTYNANSLDGSKGQKRMVESSDPLLLISVTDTGIGIDPAVLPRLFTAFEQGDITVNRTFGGLGLGLNISQVGASFFFFFCLLLLLFFSK